ncbi:IS5 family transposase [Ktedonosporobacter rubrisoli]|uniref:IS5 family transposase n=1 Tax=Ktedonosporobacter rubrisoli TaxID=2509675 RepID=A0A4P6JYF2_KTERU|nr:IS5 family transposase [Ktedonosporobacter rubrisoli]QBD80512.1 IS5 family transposase [Ktedonosporobacter rubrisoli]
MTIRKPYPSDVPDEEWAFIAPYLTLLPEDAGQRQYEMREVLNGLRWIVRTGASWRMMPHDLPPWYIVVSQQTQRWLAAGCFEAIVHDVRLLLQGIKGRKGHPSAAIFESHTLQSTPESGHRAGYDGAKRHKGSKVHVAVDTLGDLLALLVTPANEQDRAQVGELAAVQAATGEHVELAYVDAGYTGDEPEQAAKAQGIRLEVVKLPEAKRGFVLLPRRWVVERSFAWTTRFRRMVHDYERLPATLAGLHLVVFAWVMLHQFIQLKLSP